MKDNLQNIADLIGALAEDIEEIKKILGAKDAPDKDEAVKRLAVKLEPVIRFFGGSTPENINGIFGSKEAIEDYKKSLGEEMIVSLQVYTDAHVEKDKRLPGKAQQRQDFGAKLWQAIRPDRVTRGIRRLWNKIPDGWYKNPYAWAGIIFTLVFFVLSAASWVRWHEYREENRRLRTVADKYQVTSVMLNELYPELAVTVEAYEKLAETIGADSTLAVFHKRLEQVRNEENESKQ